MPNVLMKLTSANVRTIFMDCLFEDDGNGVRPEDIKNAVIVEGIINNFGFDPKKLEKHAEHIKSMLSQLPEPFKRTVGGGWSFLNACHDKDGNQWGEHRSIDELLCLGIAIKQAQILVPRDLWPSMPGGMPYVMVEG